MSFKNLPASERPRERLLKYGAEALSLTELLALIFGQGTKKRNVLLLAQELLSYFGSLEALSEASLEDLKTIKGLGMAKICQLKACFEISRRLSQPKITKTRLKENKNFVSPEDIYLQVRSKIINYHKEHFLVISLNNREKIIAVDTVSIGTLNSSLIHPRETFEVAIRHHAAQIILCHNHPSEELTPSEDDILVTKKIVAAGKILGIEVIDHLIISKKGYFSFAKEKLL